MRVHARLIGDGSTANPFRVNHPVHVLIEVDYATMEAIIEIPDTHVPASLRSLPQVVRNVRGQAHNVANMNAPSRALMRAFVRSTWREKFGNWDETGVIL